MNDDFVDYGRKPCLPSRNLAGFEHFLKFIGELAGLIRRECGLIGNPSQCSVFGCSCMVALVDKFSQDGLESWLSGIKRASFNACIEILECFFGFCFFGFKSGDAHMNRRITFGAVGGQGVEDGDNAGWRDETLKQRGHDFFLSHWPGNARAATHVLAFFGQGQAFIVGVDRARARGSRCSGHGTAAMRTVNKAAE